MLSNTCNLPIELAYSDHPSETAPYPSNEQVYILLWPLWPETQLRILIHTGGRRNAKTSTEEAVKQIS